MILFVGRFDSFCGSPFSVCSGGNRWCQVWALKRSKWDDLAADLKSILQDLMLFQLADDRRTRCASCKVPRKDRIEKDKQDLDGFRIKEDQIGTTFLFFPRSHTRKKCQRAVSSDEEGKRNLKETEVLVCLCHNRLLVAQK